MIPAYRRFESTGSDEKVKGAVIGIDLGKLREGNRISEVSVVANSQLIRHHKLRRGHHGGQGS
jgi:hypothetical protein